MREKKPKVNREEETETLHGYSLTYVYESVDGEMPKEVRVNGIHEDKTKRFYLLKRGDALTISFTQGAEYDNKLIDGVMKSVTAILKEINEQYSNEL